MAEVRQYQMVHPALYAYIKLSQGIQSAAALQVETQVSRAHIYRIWNRDWTKPMQKGKSTGRPRKITEKSTVNRGNFGRIWGILAFLDSLDECLDMEFFSSERESLEEEDCQFL